MAREPTDPRPKFWAPRLEVGNAVLFLGSTASRWQQHAPHHRTDEGSNPGGQELEACFLRLGKGSAQLTGNCRSQSCAPDRG